MSCTLAVASLMWAGLGCEKVMLHISEHQWGFHNIWTAIWWQQRRMFSGHCQSNVIKAHTHTVLSRQSKQRLPKDVCFLKLPLWLLLFSHEYLMLLPDCQMPSNSCGLSVFTVSLFYTICFIVVHIKKAIITKDNRCTLRHSHVRNTSTYIYSNIHGLKVNKRLCRGGWKQKAYTKTAPKNSRQDKRDYIKKQKQMRNRKASATKDKYIYKYETISKLFISRCCNWGA